MSSQKPESNEDEPENGVSQGAVGQARQRCSLGKGLLRSAKPVLLPVMATVLLFVQLLSWESGFQGSLGAGERAWETEQVRMAESSPFTLRFSCFLGYMLISWLQAFD